MAVFGIELDSDAYTLRLLARQKARSRTKKAVEDHIADASAVEDEPSNEVDWLCRRVKRAFLGLRTDDDTLVFCFEEFMSPEPAVCDELVHRSVVHTSDDGVSLHPDEELCEFETRFKHSFTEGKYHLVGVEDMKGILPLKMRCYSIYPVLGELSILLVALDVIVGDYLVLLQGLESFFALGHRYSIRNIADNRLYFLLVQELCDHFFVSRISAEKQMLAEAKYIPVLN